MSTTINDVSATIRCTNRITTMTLRFDSRSCEDCIVELKDDASGEVVLRGVFPFGETINISLAVPPGDSITGEELRKVQ